MRYWTPQQLRAFLEHVADDRLFALWRLAATTGMRRGELLGLQWRDLDLDGGVATIRRQWAKSNGTVSVTTLKGRQGKPRSRRVDLDAATIAALRRHSAQQLEERALTGRGRRPDDGWVFDLRDGSPIDPDGLTQRFARHVSESGLPRIRLHDLRHSSATAALAAGVHPKIVQERLGHASVTTTMNTYSHAIPTLQAAAADQIANAIDF